MRPCCAHSLTLRVASAGRPALLCRRAGGAVGGDGGGGGAAGNRRRCAAGAGGRRQLQPRRYASARGGDVLHHREPIHKGRERMGVLRRVPPALYETWCPPFRVPRLLRAQVNLMALVCTSTMWALCAACFSPAAAQSSFGFLSAGATCGQLLGSAGALALSRMPPLLLTSPSTTQPTAAAGGPDGTHRAGAALVPQGPIVMPERPRVRTPRPSTNHSMRCRVAPVRAAQTPPQARRRRPCCCRPGCWCLHRAAWRAWRRRRPGRCSPAARSWASSSAPPGRRHRPPAARPRRRTRWPPGSC